MAACCQQAALRAAPRSAAGYKGRRGRAGYGGRGKGGGRGGGRGGAGRKQLVRISFSNLKALLGRQPL